MPILRRRRVASLCLALGLTFAATASGQPAANVQGDADFARLADAYFDQFYFPNQPTAATVAGIHRYDDRLEDDSQAGVQRYVAGLTRWEAKVAAVPRASLSEAVQGDRDLVLNSIRSQLLSLQTIRGWEKNPDVYSSSIASSAFTLMARRFASPEDRLRALIAREKRMPGVLAAGRANLKNPPRIYTEIALEQLPGLANFFAKDVVSAFAEVKDPALRKAFEASNGAVIKALNDYRAWVRSDLLPRSHGDFRIGADAYRKKLAYDEMVATPLDRLLAVGMADLKANQDAFNRAAKALDPSKSPQQVLAELAADHPPADKLLDTFRASFKALIAFIRDRHIVTLPSNGMPIVEETPPFMRATTFASMDTPGPYEKVAKEAYFNVTVPEPDWDQARTREFMAQFNYPTINNVSVHEAFPGHFVQFMWMHDIHDRVRKLLGASSNAEGWAHYSEQMMLDEGLGRAMYPNDARQQQRLRLGQLQDALLRDARYVVGIRLHTGTMSFDQAVDFFVKQGYQSHAVGLVETKRGTGDPTYLYYTLGKLEIIKLRRDVAARQGTSFNLERFHDDFMRQGFAPIAIVRRAMLHDDSPAL